MAVDMVGISINLSNKFIDPPAEITQHKHTHAYIPLKSMSIFVDANPFNVRSFLVLFYYSFVLQK